MTNLNKSSNMLYYIGAHLYLYEDNIMSVSTILHRVGSAAHTYLYVYINAVYTSTASILKDMSRIWSIVCVTQTGVSCNHIGYSSTDRGSYSHIVHTRLPATWPYLSPDTCQNKLCTLNLREGEDRSLKLQTLKFRVTSIGNILKPKNTMCVSVCATTKSWLINHRENFNELTFFLLLHSFSSNSKA